MSSKAPEMPEKIYLNPLNCQWGEKYWAGTATSEKANSIQVEYVKASLAEEKVRQAMAEAFEEARGIIETSEGDLDFALFRLKEVSRKGYQDAEKRLGEAITDCRDKAAQVRKGGA